MYINTPTRRFWRRALAAAGAAGLIAGGALNASAHPNSHRPLAGLKVLLTNDDSMQAQRPTNSDGLGLYEIRKALCAAGADVVTIAPWGVQSGRGTAVTNSGTIFVGTKQLAQDYASDCAGAPSKGVVVGLCVDTAPCGPNSPGATPSDTVKFANRGGLSDVAGWKGEPDLVVSGINSGMNVASSVTDSGTVGAAVAAIEEEIPAVAFSTSGLSDNSLFPLKNYRAAAQYGARLLGALRRDGLLQQHKFALNVNYPNVSEGKKAKKPTWVSVADGVYSYHVYEKQPDGSYAVSFKPCEGVPACEITRTDADKIWAVDRNHITVAPINWDRTYGYPVDGRRELAKVKAFVEKRAPRP